MSNQNLVVSAKAAGGIRAALSRMSARVETQIHETPFRAFALLTILYAATVLSLSSMKLLWLDELITLHIARLPGAVSIWNALARGADPNPPSTHLLVHFSRAAFGDHEWAYRLPAFAGYWVGLLCLFVYLLRRLPALWALAGTVLSMTMAAFDYSYESRSYAIFYGFAMMAFLCWSVAVDPEVKRSARQLALVGMVLALAAGISTNYFAVLAFLPVSFGECARTLQRIFGRGPETARIGETTRSSLLGAIDFRIWAGMAIAATPLLAFRSMIAHSIAQFSPYAWNKVSLDQVFDSYTEMVEVVLYPILALFVIAILISFVSSRLERLPGAAGAKGSHRGVDAILFSRPFQLPVPLHEAVGIFALMAYPILGYIIASIRGGMLSPRFVIPVCFGFAISATMVSFRMFGAVHRAGFVMLCFCLAWFMAREGYVAYSYQQQKDSFYKLIDKFPAAEGSVPPDAPIVIPDPLLALTFQHYAPPDLARRATFPVDFPAIRYYRHDDSPEENLWAGRGFLYSLPIMPLADFQQGAGRFLLIANDGNWMISDLRSHRYPVARLPIESRADDIGGFTPLAHGKPEFFSASGDKSIREVFAPQYLPIPFRASDNLPSANFIAGSDAQR